MKVKLHIDILARPGDGMQGFARRWLNLPFVPFPGLVLADPVWQDGNKRVAEVHWNVEEESFYVVLEPENLQSTDEAESVKEVYQANDWAIDGDPK